MRAYLFVIALVATSSCGPGGETSPQPSPQEQEGPRVENLPPRDAGYALPAAALVAAGPSITVDTKYSGKDKEDLEAYARAATSALSSATTAANAAALDKTYPEVWLNAVTKYEGLGSVGKLAQTPRTGFAYLPARLTMVAKGTGAYENKDPDSTTGGRMITVRKYHLDWWRSPNAVTRSCAINTLAHEMTHNMTRDPKTFHWAFTDTGLSGVTTEKGSYTMGALAQCTYLQSIGRINAAGISQCVRLWGLKKAFDSTHCDSFDDKEPVKWPKDPKPKT
jgi:hypothetical protein